MDKGRVHVVVNFRSVETNITTERTEKKEMCGEDKTEGGRERDMEGGREGGRAGGREGGRE